jgi:hypothetical protein
MIDILIALITNISLTIPIELLKKIDYDRGDIPRSRFIIRLMEIALTEIKDSATKNEKDMIPVDNNSFEGYKSAGIHY